MMRSRQFLRGGQAAETLQSRPMKANFAAKRFLTWCADVAPGILWDQSAAVAGTES